MEGELKREFKILKIFVLFSAFLFLKLEILELN